MLQQTLPLPATILLASFLAIWCAANQTVAGHNVPEFLPGVEVGTLEAPDGDEILVRSRFAASLWRRPPGTDMADAVVREPFSIRRLRDGEAIGFDARGAGACVVVRSSLAIGPLHPDDTSAGPP